MAQGATAQQALIGEALFGENCAVCHGPAGAGDGQMAEFFAQKPRNLQTLAKENNGAFPFSEVYQSIDGTRAIGGHGSSEMPVWGDLFMVEASPHTVHPGVDADEIVQGRILALVHYLQTVQQ
jgi:mono/diheme cytochrome c family protein